MQALCALAMVLGSTESALAASSAWTDQTLAGSRSWVSIAGSDNGRYLAAAATNSDIFTSDDYGATWNDRAASGSRIWSMITSTADGQHLAAAYSGGYDSNGGIVTSDDYGTTWTDQTAAGTNYWGALTYSPDGTRLEAAIKGNMITVSTDHGLTWNYQTADAHQWNGMALSTDGSRIAATEGGGSLYLSSDSGTTLTAHTDVVGALPAIDSVASSHDGKYILIGADGVGLYYSSDFGTNWTLLDVPGASAWRSVAVSANGTRLAAASWGGMIITSSDQGATWITQNAAGSQNWSSLVISTDGSRIAATVNGGDIWTGVISSETPFNGGTGTTNDPLTINDCLQLQNISLFPAYLSKSYALAHDIDCSATSISNQSDSRYDNRLYHDGAGFTPIGTFTGSFDGHDHIISNLFENQSINFAGLFSQTQNATIKNVGLTNESITNNSGMAAGGLIGYNSQTGVSKAYVAGTVVGSNNYVGGLIGYNGNSHVVNTFSTANVTGARFVGGLIGATSKDAGYPWPVSSVVDSYATGIVTGSDEVGGLIGSVDGDPVSNVFAVGLVTGGDGAASVGGLIGSVTDANGGFASNVSNSGWFRHNSGPIAAVGNAYSAGTGLNVSYNMYDGNAVGFTGGLSSWFYDRLRGVFVTRLNDEPSWDFTTPVWYEHANAYPDFFPDPVTGDVVPPSQSNTSIPTRVSNLIMIGNVAGADALKAQYPQYFLQGGAAGGAGSSGNPFGSSTLKTAPKPPVISPVVKQLFTRNLSLGSKGADVARLQAFLNANGFTIAKTGPGSIGLETNLYGPATKAAVARFQEAHASAILAPSGLTKGTGKFFGATRAFVNAMISK